MIYILAGMSLLLIGLGFIITKNNARYLLSGYNTMSEEERKNFDLDSFIPFYKNFHIILGSSMFLLGWMGHHFYGEEFTGMFLVAYPIILYAYFIFKARKFMTAKQQKSSIWAIAILVMVMVAVFFLFLWGLEENKAHVDEHNITIDGMYGASIDFDKIKSLELVDQVPKISHRSNGFSLGQTHKGYYKTEEGNKVKLILNSDLRPVLYISSIGQPDLYFVPKTEDASHIYDELRKLLDDPE